MIQVPAVIERCAGIDIGKREIAVAVITGPADEEGEIKTKAFQTTVPALEELREWLVQEGCSSVAMESTGSYWIPVKNILEGNIRIVLVCPRNHKPKGETKRIFGMLIISRICTGMVFSKVAFWRVAGWSNCAI